MIKRVRIRNYLSLKDVDLELRPMNVFVGPNMAGKSNLIDCFRFLTGITTLGLKKAFLDRGGFNEVVWKGGDETEIYIGLTAESPVQNRDKKVFSYELSILGGTTGAISVEREKLTVKVKNRAKPLIDVKGGHGNAKRENGTIAFDAPGDPTKSLLEFSVPGWEGLLFKNFVSAWHFYSLIPALMKQANAATIQDFLNEGGGNLSGWLMTLQTQHSEEFQRIKQIARDVFPSLSEILTSPTQFATTYVTTREKDLKGPVNMWHMSDGELTFLALLSLIFAPQEYGAPLVCVEEPENHLHPRLLETLVEVLTQRQAELGPHTAQVVATTHSPYLVDKLNPEDLVVVEKVDGATKFTRPATKDHLTELLKRDEMGLGELWYSGALGGA